MRAALVDQLIDVLQDVPVLPGTLGGEAPLRGASSAAWQAVATEQGKRVEVAAFCWQVMGQADFTRTDAVVGFGGGAVTDLAGFVAATPEPHFTALERYLHAAANRVAAWDTHPARERQGLDTITALEDAYAAATDRFPVGELPAEAAAVGWLLEELRVSLFAQSLGTAQPVSAKRVRSAIDALSALVGSE